MPIKIIGTGSALPSRTVSNDELREYFDTSDEWISTRTGIRSRHVITSESLLELAVSASKNAIKAADTDASEIGAIVVSTIQGDNISPSLSCLLAGRLGITSPRVTDINGGCSGFLYALDMADSIIAAGKAEKVLVVSAEAMTRHTDWNDRSTSVLFGDGAGAAVVKGGGDMKLRFTLKPSDEHLCVGGDCSNSPFDQYRPQKFIRMNGQEIYKFAVETVTREIGGLLESEGLTSSDISAFLLHQANLRIIKAIQSRLNAPEDKFPHNIERTGNTSSAGLAILLDEFVRNISDMHGQKIILSAFGSGLTTATAIITL